MLSLLGVSLFVPFPSPISHTKLRLAVAARQHISLVFDYGRSVQRLDAAAHNAADPQRQFAWVWFIHRKSSPHGINCAWIGTVHLATATLFIKGKQRPS